MAQQDVLDVLATLVDKSLVDAVGASDVRYRLLETVRAFASDRLAESGEAAAVRHRHAAHLLELAETAEPLLRGPDELVWLARLDALREDLLAALRWCIDSEVADTSVRFVAALGWYLHLRGMSSELLHWPREALALEGVVDPAALAITHAFLAMGSAEEGDLAKGAEALQVAIEKSHAARGMSVHPIVTLLEPASYLFLQQFEEGMASVDQIVAEHPDQWTRGVALILQGHAMENAGEISAVAPCYERAFQIFSDLGERWGQAIALSSLGEVQEGRSEYAEAIAGYERALSYLRELGTSDDVSTTLTRLARMRLLTGDRAGAERDLREAQEMARRFNAPVQAAIVEVGLAHLDRFDGKLAEAESRLRVLSTGPALALGFGQLRAIVVAALARVIIEAGRLDDARDLLVQGFAHARRSRDVPVIAEVIGHWAALALAEGDPAASARIAGLSVAVRGLGRPATGDLADVFTAVHERIGEADFTAAYDAGAGLDRDEAMADLIAWAGLTPDQLDELAQL